MLGTGWQMRGTDTPPGTEQFGRIRKVGEVVPIGMFARLHARLPSFFQIHCRRMPDFYRRHCCEDCTWLYTELRRISCETNNALTGRW